MSFSFTAAGTPKEVIAVVGKEAANQPGVPKGFADSVNDQLSGLPDDCEATLSCHGHTGTNDGQLQGNLTLHAQIDWRAASLGTVERIVDKDPEVQPGPERFPEGFEEETPAGPGAGERAA